MADIVGTLEDGSGTITTGGTAQTVFDALPYRRYLLIENISGGDLWVNFGIAAVQNQPSLKIPANGAAEFSMLLGVIPSAYVSVVGATTGQAFVAKEA